MHSSFSTSYKAIKQKMENVCPVDQQINNDDKPFWSFIGEGKLSEQEQR